MTHTGGILILGMTEILFRTNKKEYLQEIFPEYSSDKSWQIFQSYNNDKEIMTEIVKYYPKAFRHIGEELKGDKELALIPVKHGFGNALFYVSKELLEDEEFVLKAVKAGFKESFYDFYSHFNMNAGKCFPLSIKNNLSNSSSLFSNGEFVLKAVAVNGMFLKYLDEKFKSDKEVVLAAVKENGFAIKYASVDLQQDDEVIITAVRQNLEVIGIVKDKTEGKTQDVKTKDRRTDAPKASEDEENIF